MLLSCTLSTLGQWAETAAATWCIFLRRVVHLSRLREHSDVLSFSIFWETAPYSVGSRLSWDPIACFRPKRSVFSVLYVSCWGFLVSFGSSFLMRRDKIGIDSSKTENIFWTQIWKKSRTMSHFCSTLWSKVTRMPLKKILLILSPFPSYKANWHYFRFSRNFQTKSVKRQRVFLEKKKVLWQPL